MSEFASLWWGYQESDSIQYILQALECEDDAHSAVDTEVEFTQYCIEDEDEDGDPDERPVIYISSSKFHFNITNDMYIKDLEFSGITALTQNLYTPGLPVHAYLPYNFCGVSRTAKPLHENVPLKLSTFKEV